MNFKHFLLEGTDAKALIEKDCAEFLRKTGRTGMLFRNVQKAAAVASYTMSIDGKTVEVPIAKRKVRKDRVPTSMGVEQSKIIDDWFEKEFGVRARSQALFCYGSRGQHLGTSYGPHKVAVFPIGEFKVIWSPEIDDLYDFIPTFVTRTGPAPSGEAKIQDWLDNQYYTDGDLKDAVVGDKELMLVCDEYYAVQFTSDLKIHDFAEAMNIELK